MISYFVCINSFVPLYRLFARVLFYILLLRFSHYSFVQYLPERVYLYPKVFSISRFSYHSKQFLLSIMLYTRSSMVFRVYFLFLTYLHTSYFQESTTFARSVTDDSLVLVPFLF